MRIDILAIGSRGDVQPYVALGLGLQMAGHRVRVVTLGGFEQSVRGLGLDHLAIGGSPQEIAKTAAGQDWVQKRSSVAGFVRGFVGVAGPLIEQGIASYWEESRQADAIISSPMGMLAAESVAERLRIPLIDTQLAPPAMLTRYSWSGEVNLRSIWRGLLEAGMDVVFQTVMWNLLRTNTNAARQGILELPELGRFAPLRASRRKRLALLGGYSPAVARKKPDWPDWIHVTGYWFLDDESCWTPPPELLDFLNKGPESIFIGFGSTPFPDPQQTTAKVVRAVERAGQRAILVAGGSGLSTGRLSEAVLGIDSVPHAWLFPRVRAAVHHGGAGVTGAALRAGLPSVVVPVFADQPFWSGRVYELGVGPKPIPARQLSEDNLADAIRATTHPEIRRRAAELGEMIRAEDGVGRAVEIIGRCVGGGTGASVARTRVS
ncbi:MAG TPA: glycosyltransferase [Bryobacteraceae bacterium]|nr:glycosyltransferase [Bryobacteraceae bacterium]